MPERGDPPGRPGDGRVRHTGAAGPAGGLYGHRHKRPASGQQVR